MKVTEAQAIVDAIQKGPGSENSKRTAIIIFAILGTLPSLFILFVILKAAFVLGSN